MSAKPVSRKRRIVKLSAAILFNVLSIELLCWSLLHLIPETQSTPYAPLGVTTEESVEMLHPYCGYLNNPRGPYAKITKVGSFGFFGDDPIFEREPNTVIVGVCGGSVAVYTGVSYAELLRTELEKLPRFQGRKVKLVSVALGGWHQPQQLNAVTWLLAMGAKFDLMINIDGFNENIVAGVEAPRDHHHYVFPRGWPLRTAGASPPLLPLATKVFMVREKHAAWRDMQWMRHEYLGECIWRMVDSHYVNQVFETNAAMQKSTAAAPSHPQGTGPAVSLEIQQAGGIQSPRGTQELAYVWARSSLALRGVCEAHGIEYVHVLQPCPNDDAKVLTAAEKVRLFPPGSDPCQIITKTYPLLRAEGAKLAASGEKFLDLTGVFRDTPETIYVDECHLNQAGHLKFAQAIAKYLGSQPHVPKPLPAGGTKLASGG